MKPASLTPATAHALTEIIHEAGFPKGVFNLILGRRRHGRRARRASGCRRRFVHRLARASARGVAKAAMSHNARVQLEMGGKNPLVVLDDCDLDRAGAMRARRRASSRPASAARPRAASSSRRASTTSSSKRWPRASRR